MENKTILRKYFYKWYKLHIALEAKRDMVIQQIEQKQKVDNLVKALKKYKKERPKTDLTEDKKIVAKPCKSATETYKNRWEAQKNIIQNLTLKLDAKDRMIEELKLGVLQKTAHDSILEARFEIREIFADCSVKNRCKIAPPQDYNEKFMITTQKAPKILQELEARAMERAKKREIITERKKLIEATRKRIALEIVEKKRVQDEEEKKRNLETIKETRQKQLELERKRKERKEIFLRKLELAVVHHKMQLLKRGFESFRQNYLQSIHKYISSVKHYRRKLLHTSFNTWQQFVESKYSHKYFIADQLYNYKIISKTFQLLHFNLVQATRAHQVAEDFNDWRLLRTTFVRWHRNVCVIIVSTEKKMKLARQHHKKKLLFNYFYQWRSLPAVMQLERAKEMKKKKWREKVWEILPDYEPPVD